MREGDKARVGRGDSHLGWLPESGDAKSGKIMSRLEKKPTRSGLVQARVLARVGC